MASCIGGPLSPLRSNLLLTGLDRRLERRGHASCRYANVRGRLQHRRQKPGGGASCAGTSDGDPWRSGSRSTGAKARWPALGSKVSGLQPGMAPAKHGCGSHRPAGNGSRGRSASDARGRGCSFAATVTSPDPKLRGGTVCCRCPLGHGRAAGSRRGTRDKLRGLLWRQGERPCARARALMRRGAERRTRRFATRSVVGRRRQSPGRGRSESLLRLFGAVSLVSSHQRFRSLMNRRMRNRMSGGVGGRRVRARRLPGHLGLRPRRCRYFVSSPRFSSSHCTSGSRP